MYQILLSISVIYHIESFNLIATFKGQLLRKRLIQRTICLIFLVFGCSHTQPSPGTARQTGAGGGQENVTTALQAVVGGVSGQEVQEQDLRGLIRQVQKDEEARSAVESISEAVGQTPPVVMYCPLCGGRYSPELKLCPIHNVPLKTVAD